MIMGRQATRETAGLLSMAQHAPVEAVDGHSTRAQHGRPPRPSSHTRDRIWALIQADPGVHKSDLKRMTGLSWGTISHHVSRLESSGRIRVHRVNNRAMLFPVDIPPERWNEMALLRQTQALQVLEALADGDRVNVSWLAARLGMSAKSLRRILGELESAGLICKRGRMRPDFQIVDPQAPPGRGPLVDPGAVGMFAVYQIEMGSPIAQ